MSDQHYDGLEEQMRSVTQNQTWMEPRILPSCWLFSSLRLSLTVVVYFGTVPFVEGGFAFHNSQTNNLTFRRDEGKGGNNDSIAHFYSDASGVFLCYALLFVSC